MGRPARLEYAGAFYHVFSRGNRKELIYRDQHDYVLFQAALLDLAVRCHIDLFAWCLMPNHFHLVVRTPNSNLSVFMRRLLTRYAIRFNQRHKLVGHVFQSRYKAVVCEQEAYFLQLIRYVHQNPLGKGKRGLVSSLNDWPWSSHHFYSAGANPNGTCISEALKCFSDQPEKARRSYGQFMKQPEAFREKKFEVNGIFGSETFIEKAKTKHEEPVRESMRALDPGMSAETLTRQTESLFGLKEKQLMSANAGRTLSRIRKAVAYIGRNYFRLEATALARAMGRGTAAISRMVERVEIRGGVEKEIKIITTRLSKEKLGVEEKDRRAVMCKR